MRYLSTFNSDQEILVCIDDIHLRGKWIGLDCTYSKGVFYKNIKEPFKKSDLFPLYDDVVECDTKNMSCFFSGSIENIVFDPPFLFRDRVAKNDDKMCKRFSYFKSYDELKDMYIKSMTEIYRILKKGSYLLFKCQDMTDGKFYCTHNMVINEAEKIGFTLRDIVMKITDKKLQKDAKQQNCVAKVHSYWLVLKKQPK